jgi:hypothetical protein
VLELTEGYEYVKKYALKLLNESYSLTVSQGIIKCLRIKSSKQQTICKTRSLIGVQYCIDKNFYWTNRHKTDMTALLIIT